MSYNLGIDLGTTFTAAALGRSGRTELVSLGDRSAAVPSVVLLREDGTVLTGDAADRRASAESERVAREFKRRLGDPTPLVLGGAPYSAAALTALLLEQVVARTARTEGAAPASVTLTHPANWGPYKRELFDQVPQRAGIEDVRMLTEPEAAAAYYASTERMENGAIVAVYDLGGGTFDATVLRKLGSGFEILGTPEGIESLGGIDFDEAIFAHVNQSVDHAFNDLDRTDPRVVSGLSRLRRECVLAKEALSADTETTVPVLLPDLQTEVRLTRGEFEQMIRPSIAATIQSVRRALRSAGVEAEDVSTVLLVGGSSRIPLVSHLVSAELGRPTAVDAHPKYAIALGAAVDAELGTKRAAMSAVGMAPVPTHSGGRGVPAGVAAAVGAGAALAVPARSVPAEHAADVPPRGGSGTLPPVSPGTAPPDGAARAVGAGAPPPALGKSDAAGGRSNRRRFALVAAAAVLVMGAAAGAVALATSGGGEPAPAAPPAVQPADAGKPEPAAPANGGAGDAPSGGGIGDTGGTGDGGGTGTGGWGDGGTDTGGTDTGGTDTGGTDTGGTDTGGTDTGGTDTGGTDTGGTDTGGTDTGGADTGGADTGGTDSGQ